MLQTLINPYKVGPPVTGASFYGRTKLLKLVRKDLSHSKVVLLQGQRRIGKTSFLKQLASSLMEKDQEPINVPVIFDIQRYVQMSLPQFQLSLAERIVKQLESQGLIFSSINGNHSSPSQINNTGLIIPNQSDLEAKPNFFLDSWLPKVYDLLGEYSLVILVDEFDNFDRESSSQSMQTLIPFLGQIVSTQDQIKWVFAVGKQIGKLPIQYDSIMNLGVKRRIGFLEKSETRQLLEKPVKEILSYHQAAIDRIYDLTNGQPHLTQALGSEIFQSVFLEQNRSSVLSEDVDSIIPNTLDVYGGAIASIVRVPPIEERILAVVTQLTKTNSTTNRDEIIETLLSKNLKIRRDELTETLKSLLEWKLLTGSLQDLRVSVELIKIWLNQNLHEEASPEESLNIQYLLANRRLALADKERDLGNYESAIRDYQDTLEHIPSNIGALRGLAEAYRLTRNSEGRVKTLQQLYLHDSKIHNELIEALLIYAEQSEKEKNFLIAAEQYEELLKLQDSNRWQQRLFYNLIESFKNSIELADKQLESSSKTQNLMQKGLPDLEKIEFQMEKTTNTIKFWIKSNPKLSDEFAVHQKSVYEEKKILILNKIQILKAINNGEYIKAALAWNNLSQILNQKGLKLSQSDRETMKIIAGKIIIEKAKNPLISFFALFLLVVWINYPWHKYVRPFLTHIFTYIFYDLPLTIFFRPLSSSLEFLDFMVNGISKIMHSITHFPNWIFRLPLSILLFLTWLFILYLIVIILKIIFDDLFSATCKILIKNIAEN
jgi:tetratricopeptide (TPR) repeat protein